MSHCFAIRKANGHVWLERRLIVAGWCPYWSHVYAQKLSPFQLYYLSGLSPPRHESHQACQAVLQCNVYNLDYKTYHTRHAQNCDAKSCSFHGVEGEDRARLASIISTRGIPLIRLQPKDRHATSHIEIDLVEHPYGNPFTAISHVWSGGLGHFGANTLPQCQIDSLYRIIRLCKPNPYGSKFPMGVEVELDWAGSLWQRMLLHDIIEDESTVYLRIDTPCIPAGLQTPNHKTVQMKAIESMALVYSMATRVLVIGPSIRKLSLHLESGLSLASKLLTCPWITRS